MIRKLASDFVHSQSAVWIAALLVASAPMATFGQGTVLVSPELHQDGRLTFRLERSGVHEVLVPLAGLEKPLKMTEAQGVWSVTSAPLLPGTYWYSFLVDGKAELDPLNQDVIPSYTFLNSVVRVPGPGPSPWERTDVPHGEVHHHFYESKLVKGLPGGRSEYFVYTPPGYEAHRSTTYPILYLLHGLSEGAADWTVMGGANFVLDNLIAQGKAKPMVVVMPLGYTDMAVVRMKGPSDKGFGPAITANIAPFREVLLNEIAPRIEAEYRVMKTRDGRALAGLSMGGAQSLHMGLNSAGQDGTGEFAWIGAFSAGTPYVKLPSVSGPARKLRLLWIGCGTGDALLEPNRKFIQDLQQLGYTVKPVETPGAHIWPVWQRNLVDFVQLLF